MCDMFIRVRLRCPSVWWMQLSNALNLSTSNVMLSIRCHVSTQLFPCSVLGRGVLPSLDYAAERLIVPGARVVPAAVQVSGLHHQLSAESR